MQALIALLIWILCWPFVTMWRAYVIIVLWGWFVMPVFNIPAPSIYIAAGLLIFLHVCLPFQRPPKTDEGPIESILGSIFGYGLVGPALVLGVAWTWKWLQWGVV